MLIQKIYTHFKKAPGTHKLGVLYVVDSVTRQWVDAARKAGQPTGPGTSAPDGTFAAGVNRVTELLPVLMGDIVTNAPQDQKVRTRHAYGCSPPLYDGGQLLMAYWSWQLEVCDGRDLDERSLKISDFPPSTTLEAVNQTHF